jgi:hypothetical protein
VKTVKTIGIIILLLGIIGVGIGGAFVGLGMLRNNQVADALRAEKVTLGLDANAVATGQVVDTSAEAQKAAEVLGEHRKSIAPTYSDLLAGGKFDPTVAKQLTYAQAMNLQSYFFTAVIAFGLAQSVMANGLFMIMVGVALIVAGIALHKISKKIV